MNRTKIVSLLCVLAIFITTGCGYTTSSLIYSGAKTIYVDNFTNKIKMTEEVTDKRMYIGYRSGMELGVTRDIKDRLITDGNLKVVPKRDADLILEGELVDFRKEALMFDSGDNVTEFRIKVVVNIKLLEAKTGNIILEEKNFTGESTYRTTGSFAKSESQSIQDASKDLATRLVEAIVEGW